MSDYKFNIGDEVKILKIDNWSCEEMENDIGKFGIIIECDNEDGINGYAIKLSKDASLFSEPFWYMEDSLKLVKSKKLNNKIVSQHEVTNIVWNEMMRDYTEETYSALLNILNKIERLPCK